MKSREVGCKNFFKVNIWSKEQQDKRNNLYLIYLISTIYDTDKSI